jgi:hypothetical protein
MICFIETNTIAMDFQNVRLQYLNVARTAYLVILTIYMNHICQVINDKITKTDLQVIDYYYWTDQKGTCLAPGPNFCANQFHFLFFLFLDVVYVQLLGPNVQFHMLVLRRRSISMHSRKCNSTFFLTS